MAAAVKLAERGLFTVTRGNPRVGCLIVKDGQVVGRGWHEADGQAHAELNAIKQAGDAVKDSTVYVSLEPCCFEGRTRACTEVLAEHAVKRVVIGSRDPHPQVRGKGIDRLKELGLEVKLMGLPNAGMINPGLNLRYRRKRPLVRIKTAMSLDGRIAMASGKSRWITSSEARRDVQYWRARSGAIMTGIRTVLADDPHLTVREAEYASSQPWRVVLDSQGRFPATAAMLEDEARVIVVCGRDAHGASMPERVDVWHALTPRVELQSVLERLAEEGVNELLVEAGSELVGSFMANGLWDEMIAYIAPKLMGDGAKPVAAIRIEELAESIGATIKSQTIVGDDVRLVLHRRNGGE